MTNLELKKINKEPFYNSLYKKNSFSFIDEGGFFFDTNNKKIDWKLHTNLLCTPINFLSKINGDKNCILISTGAFSPLHDGHIEMMDLAKSKMENNGWNVLGGYLSPGHDEYIKQKTGSDWIAIHDRIKYANDKIKNIDWLAIDPWEGVFAPGAVNFSSVVYRLQKYLQKHTNLKNVSIFFVCGADNARFALTFSEYQENQEFGTVIVGRPKYDGRIEKYKKLNNVYTCTGNNTLSSTQLRIEGFKIDPKPSQIYFRMFWNHLEKSIMVSLKKYFKVVWTLDITEQNKQIFRENFTDVINLDKESVFEHNLNVSRIFDVYGQKHLGFENGPETNKSIEKQIKDLKINTKDVYLFDDDIYSGNTMSYISSMLNNNGFNVKGKISHVCSNNHSDILDSSDFIIGSNSGLVIKYKNKKIRVPYIYPFVCPTTRASISDPLQFSIDIYKINMDYYQDKNTLLSDVNMTWTYSLGFNKNSTVYDFCKYYHELLLLLMKKYYI